MSVGFIMYEIVDMDSLKYQGINTPRSHYAGYSGVGYSLKNQGINTTEKGGSYVALVGYSLINQGINTSSA